MKGRNLSEDLSVNLDILSLISYGCLHSSVFYIDALGSSMKLTRLEFHVFTQSNCSQLSSVRPIKVTGYTRKNYLRLAVSFPGFAEYAMRMFFLSFSRCYLYNAVILTNPAILHLHFFKRKFILIH